MATESEMMAECMHALRLSLISAQVIDQDTPPMFVDDAVIAKVRRLESDYAALVLERDGLLEQHGRDSAELRSLCAARDEARRDRDRLREALEKIADTDPDDGTSWFHDVARAALAGEGL